jgi:uncharacterized protein (DUF486 family)
MLTIILLIISNIFMTIAWYGHLKYQNVPMWKVTLVRDGQRRDVGCCVYC